MRVVKSQLSSVPKVPCETDSNKGLLYLPNNPLPKKNFVMLFVGAPKSGKTNLLFSMMLSKKPRYYRRLFDKTYLFSASLATLPPKVKQGKDSVPDEQMFDEFDEDVLQAVLTVEKKGDNNNTLLIFDDVIKSISRSKLLSKVFLNRRHCLQNECKKGLASLSVMITTQKYNLLPLEFRNAVSDVFIFNTTNNAELRAIKEELMADLNPDEQTTLLKAAWSKPFGFLYIKVNELKSHRYHLNFDRVVFEEQRKRKREIQPVMYNDDENDDEQDDDVDIDE